MSDEKEQLDLPVPSNVPNFSGSWQGIKHENLAALLETQGLSAATASAALAAPFKMIIRQSDQRFEVSTNGHEHSYHIGVTGNPLESTMEWRGQQLLSYSGESMDDPDAVLTIRELQDDLLHITIKKGDVVAKRILERLAE